MKPNVHMTRKEARDEIVRLRKTLQAIVKTQGSDDVPFDDDHSVRSLCKTALSDGELPEKVNSLCGTQ